MTQQRTPSDTETKVVAALARHGYDVELRRTGRHWHVWTPWIRGFKNSSQWQRLNFSIRTNDEDAAREHLFKRMQEDLMDRINEILTRVAPPAGNC